MIAFPDRFSSFKELSLSNTPKGREVSWALDKSIFLIIMVDDDDGLLIKMDGELGRFILLVIAS